MTEPKKRSAMPWEPVELRFLEDYYATTAIDDLCETLGRTRASIHSKAAEIGLKKPGERRLPLPSQRKIVPVLLTTADTWLSHQPPTRGHINATCKPTARRNP